ncbi:hypothetical protein [Salmonella enterica]|uniref:Membrane protein n=1 Tax=Salmonella enterica subsp. salamae TaxID=59202 RepID=A0A5Y2LPJ7_SALER|nr:hypothetical protein [Salmonella enterica]EAA5903846.1 hypothetical protein [Salmonella enterica subsp. enterica]EBW4677984.1 hypothetical protein [Salmonella enterica subsp. salamae serovar Sofia]EDW0468118.1 hypothetical protein [Salmonella enterica subsp. enterica serovar Victoria]EKR2073610.1 hypothetical protein [Salmonella enterica subsp. salamae serovar 9,46:l,w:e,n,x]HCA3405938.1 hypothetical protein [Salmonella enterica subsp. salamae serovar 35:g,m,s,t:-]
MSLKKTENTQHKLKQTSQLRLWLMVGGVCSLGMGILNIMSSGYIQPYDGGQIILGLGCLGYSLALSKKISQLQAENPPKKP